MCMRAKLVGCCAAKAGVRCAAAEDELSLLPLSVGEVRSGRRRVRAGGSQTVTLTVLVTLRLTKSVT